MTNIDIKLLNSESFVEEEVIQMEVDQKKMQAIISVEGAMLENGKYINDVLIKIHDWTSISACKLNDVSKHFEEQIINEHVFLSQIIEFNIENQCIKLAGFGKKGGWIEWIFINAEIQIATRGAQ